MVVETPAQYKNYLHIVWNMIRASPKTHKDYKTFDHRLVTVIRKSQESSDLKSASL